MKKIIILLLCFLFIIVPVKAQEEYTSDLLWNVIDNPDPVVRGEILIYTISIVAITTSQTVISIDVLLPNDVTFIGSPMPCAIFFEHTLECYISEVGTEEIQTILVVSVPNTFKNINSYFNISCRWGCSSEPWGWIEVDTYVGGFIIYFPIII